MPIRPLLLCSILLLFCLVGRSQKDSTFVRDVPEEHEPSGGPEVYKSIFSLTDSLHLDTLEKGYDSLEIRFWLANRSWTRQVIILKYHDGRSLAYSVIFTLHLNKARDSTEYIERTISQITPSVAWNSVWDSLFHLRVMTLPHFTGIKNYPIPNDGPSVSIEIATPHIYRQYGYYAPYTAAYEKIPEAVKVIRMLELIEREFGIKVIDGFIKR